MAGRPLSTVSTRAGGPARWRSGPAPDPRVLRDECESAALARRPDERPPSRRSWSRSTLDFVPRMHRLVVDRDDAVSRMHCGEGLSAGGRLSAVRPDPGDRIDLLVFRRQKHKREPGNTTFMVTPARMTTIRFQTGLASNIRSGGMCAISDATSRPSCRPFLRGRHLHVAAERSQETILGFSDLP